MKPAPVAVNTAANKPQINTPKSSWFRRVLVATLVLLLLLIAAVLTLPYALPWLLQQQGIDFDWHNPQWHSDGFSASQLQLTVPGNVDQAKHLQLSHVRLTWAWHKFPIQHLHIEHLQAQWPLNSSAADSDDSSLTLPNALLRWLPQSIDLQHLDADLAGAGHLQGALKLQANAQGKLWQPSFIDSQLTLSDLQGAWLDSIPAEFQPKQFSAHISTHPDHQDRSDGRQLLSFDLHSLGPARLQLNGLLTLEQTPLWQGRLSHAQLFMQLDAITHPDLHAQALQTQIYFNAQADAEHFTLEINEHSSLEAQQVQLPDRALAQRITAHLAGLKLQGSSNAPQHMTLESPLNLQIEQLSAAPLQTQNWDLTGTINGELPNLQIKANLTNQQGIELNSQITVREDAIQGRLTLEDIAFNDSNPLQLALQDWPSTATIKEGSIGSQIDFTLPQSGPIQLALRSHSSDLQASLNHSQLHTLNLQLSAELELQPSNNWQATLNNGQLRGTLNQLSDPSVRVQQIQAQADFTGQISANQLTVNFAKNTAFSASTLKLTELGQASQASLKLPDLHISSPLQSPLQVTASSTVSAHLEQLSSPQLHPQNWDFNGTLKGQLPQLTLNGELNSQHGLSLASTMTLSENAMQGSATLKDVFFKAGNPLQKTLKDWPELVSFNSGRLQTRINFTQPSSGPLKLNLNGSASGLSGIVNRSELKNLDLAFNGSLAGQTLKLSLPRLSIEQLNPGIVIESIALHDAHYQAQLKQPLQGMADWQQIQAHLLNGSVMLNAQQFDLSRQQTLPLQVRGLELQELLKVYPAEGLAGNATIDGVLPIHFVNGEFYIEAGQLQARQPGVLQFQSDKINALGKSNPAMRLVADALEDFHFNVLSSALSYDQSGKLLLNIRLEGQNPDIEKGRPIHLNINLEEDIPALLASIQLSGQVSDIIQKRVRERLEKR